MSKKYPAFKNVSNDMPNMSQQSSKFPELYHGRPEWPSKDDDHLFWIGLNTKFHFAHHPVKDSGELKPANTGGDAKPDAPTSFFCRPAQIADQLLGVLRETPGGGSILVTGYRGTGKTSLVNQCLSELQKEKKNIAVAHVNMATVASAHDVLLLAYNALISTLVSESEKGEPQKEPVGSDKVERLQAKLKTLKGSEKKEVRHEVLRSLLKRLIDRVFRWPKEAVEKINKWKSGWWSTNEVEKCLESARTEEEAQRVEGRMAGLKKRVAELRIEEKRLRATRVVERREARAGIDPIPTRNKTDVSNTGGPSEQTFEGEALSRYQAALVGHIKMLEGAPFNLDLVFVFDEVDKLMPVDGWQDDKPDEVPSETKNLASLQQIVAELKYFLSESPSQQIFIAGKDVDDSWAEDQNKGEGLFESIFACNIHVPSIFTLELEPCVAPLPECLRGNEAEKFYTTLAGQLGIPRNSLVFRTALLILPHLAEYEIVQLLTRAYLRKPELPVEILQRIKKWLVAYAEEPSWKQPGLLSLKILQKRAEIADKDAKIAGECAEAAKKVKEDAKLWKDWPQNPTKIRKLIKEANETSEAAEAAVAKSKEASEAKAAKEQEAKEEEERQKARQGGPKKQKDEMTRTEWFDLAPMSERTCRRLRILMEYLTYKGRGIPRKILREFYGMAKPASCVSKDDPGFPKLWTQGVKRHEPPKTEDCKKKAAVKYVLAFPQHHLQKMNFYAAIVEHLDQNFALLRGLNDKGRVAIFHILDYLLKFYSAGFSHRDLEHAPFMTDREEFFPSRQLAALILHLMDGRLWRRKDSRSPDYRMLHHVTHDLGVMFLRYGPEQMELRHTPRDFREELPHLRKELENINAVQTDQRLAPIHAQMRWGRIMELCGRNYEARLKYYIALRWLRMDITYFEKNRAEIERTRAETIQFTQSSLELGQSQRYPVAFASYLMETHVALGRLLEEVGEFRAAIQHFEEAFHISTPFLEKKGLSQPSGYYPIVGPPTQAEAEHQSYANALWHSLSAEGQDIAFVGGAERGARHLADLMNRRPPMEPLRLEDIPQGFLHVCNHAATAYSKLWERASADAYLLRGLLYLDLVGDEYGLVDQMFFIGQIMVRRRDLVAGAMWYRAALRKVKAIRDYSCKGLVPAAQTGARWQTPPILSTTEAQIFAALGDVTFATDGFAFHAPGATPKAPETAEKAKENIWRFITNELGLPVLPIDDRWEEYFFTQARRSFEADDRDGDARDVYLRQLESRFRRFEQAIGWIDQDKAPGTKANHEYTALNAWTNFWRGARVLIHKNLTPITSLSRDKEQIWGRITDFRRMGNTLRLIGGMLMELGLRAGDSRSRQLLAEASIQLGQKPGVPNSTGAPLQFYERVLHNPASKGLKPNVETIRDAHKTGLNAIVELIDDEKMNDLKNTMRHTVQELGTSECASKWWNSFARINVNTAASDIQLIFSFIGDRMDLIAKDLNGAKHVGHVGSRSPLFRLNGDAQQANLPIAELWERLSAEGEHLPVASMALLSDHLSGRQLVELCRCEKDTIRRELDRRFKLLAIAEKALLSSYLCYRDCIPDYAYAQSCIHIAELYAAALFKLGTWTDKSLTLESDQTGKIVAQAVDHLTEYAKRFLMKAIDILKREQEQNRNTFHLMSEAWFNLGDILVIRLLSITGSTEELKSELLAGRFEGGAKSYFQILQTEKDPQREMCDICPEDLRRQITDAYQHGLRFVQDEMNDFRSRYRMPGDVFYANRNIMDPVLHFRICRATSLRYGGGEQGEEEDHQTHERRFEDTWHEISDLISGYESPQAYGHSEEVGIAPSLAWVRQLKSLLGFANQVRTDRGPLQWVTKSDGKKMVGWLGEDAIANPQTQRRFIFHGGASP